MNDITLVQFTKEYGNLYFVQYFKGIESYMHSGRSKTSMQQRIQGFGDLTHTGKLYQSFTLILEFN